MLSGYCLMLPIAKSATGELRGGFGAFIKRRARRILPLYYIALGFCLLLIAVMSQIPHQTNPRWSVSLSDFHPGVLLSHALLLHNLRDDWLFRIDPPMWSIATEWQIYFLFPLLLLPVWRRLGIWAAVAVGFLVGYAPLVLFPGVVDQASFWYLGLFALGMAGAVIGFSDKPAARQWRDKTPWGTLCLVFTTISFWKLQRNWKDNWSSDPLIGLAAVCLIAACARMTTDPTRFRPNRILRLLTSSSALALSGFSYSIYLVHYPVLSLCHSLLMYWRLRPTAQMALLLAIAVPLSLLASYLFHLIFERRFLPGRSTAPRAAAQTVAQSPAP